MKESQEKPSCKIIPIDRNRSLPYATDHSYSILEAVKLEFEALENLLMTSLEKDAVKR